MIGESAFWTAELEETPGEEDVALLDDSEEGNESQHERKAREMDESESTEAWEDNVSRTGIFGSGHGPW